MLIDLFVQKGSLSFTWNMEKQMCLARSHTGTSQTPSWTDLYSLKEIGTIGGRLLATVNVFPVKEIDVDMIQEYNRKKQYYLRRQRESESRLAQKR